MFVNAVTSPTVTPCGHRHYCSKMEYTGTEMVHNNKAVVVVSDDRIRMNNKTCFKANLFFSSCC